ncbi:MAG TPA: hypothetical protein VFU02_19845 [Polyangiaceae bacterium]|nr:hypothetical protein [Polyangiaceae bacterium]
MTTLPRKVGAGLFATTLVVAAWSHASPIPGPSHPHATEPHAAAPACLHVRAEARRAATGYEHWVFIDSDCDLPAACDISTNVNPESMMLTIQPRSTGSVLTAANASTEKFTPYVTCHLGPAD